jgi:hypothetical protein
MTEGLLGTVATLLPVLLLVPLVWIVAGFLADSVGMKAPTGEEPPTRAGQQRKARGSLLLAILYVGFGIYHWGGDSSDRVLSLIWAVCALASLADAAKLLRAARRMPA